MALGAGPGTVAGRAPCQRCWIRSGARCSPRLGTYGPKSLGFFFSVVSGRCWPLLLLRPEWKLLTVLLDVSEGLRLGTIASLWGAALTDKGNSLDRQGEWEALKWKEVCFHIDRSLKRLHLAVKMTTKCFSSGRKSALKSRSEQASAAFSVRGPN